MKMKAVVYTQYGPPEVAQLQEVVKPIPKDNEVLIKVYASTVNRTDAGFRSAEYFISRFWSGLFRPKYPILGCEFAGMIEAIGQNVTTFKIGDNVFGFNDKTWGGHGEYLTIAENEAITNLPANARFYEAAPITEGAHYALNNIRAAKVQRGQNVLVYGATGAIGSAAVQLLTYYGAHVTAVCNTKNVGLIKSLGAEEVIDYQTQDFTDTDKRFEFICQVPIEMNEKTGKFGKSNFENLLVKEIQPEEVVESDFNSQVDHIANVALAEKLPCRCEYHLGT